MLATEMAEGWGHAAEQRFSRAGSSWWLLFWWVCELLLWYVFLYDLLTTLENPAWSSPFTTFQSTNETQKNAEQVWFSLVNSALTKEATKATGV